MSGGRDITVIFTNSYDLTVNRLIDAIGPEGVFRINFDLWRDYAVSIRPEGFEIGNPAGRRVAQAQVAKFLWRKPLSQRQLRGHQAPPKAGLLARLGRRSKQDRADRFAEEEMRYALREIKNAAWRAGRLVLIEPMAYLRLGKLVQMELAQRHFRVPAYRFDYDPALRRAPRRRVVKSLTSEPVDENTFLWTSVIAEDALDAASPWLVQDLIEATHDVTVVHVRGRSFGFALDRRPFAARSVDWRELGNETAAGWKPHPLPPALEREIAAFMQAASLHYGRLDFLLADDTYWFLEVNANGEWDWLDPDGTNGVRRTIAAEIHPATPVHPIPVSPCVFA